MRSIHKIHLQIWIMVCSYLNELPKINHNQLLKPTAQNQLLKSFKIIQNLIKNSNAFIYN